MKERPILFSGPMIRAVLDGRKTQTRRVIKWKAYPGYTGNLEWLGFSLGNPFTGHPESGWCLYSKSGACWNQRTQAAFCPYGKPGDRLWLKETWQPHCAGPISDEFPLGTCVKYRADGSLMKPENWSHEQGAWAEAHENDNRWRPSIFMPRWASRITLEITGVQVERVQGITEEDAIAEGIAAKDCWAPISGRKGDTTLKDPVWAYSQLWDSINGKKHPWVSNPWVFVINFKPLTQI